MTCLFILGGFVIAIFGGLLAVGMLSSKKERAAAPRHLALARQLYEDGDLNRSLVALSRAFWVPLNGHYEEEDAHTAYSAVSLLRDIFEQMNADAASMLDDLLADLEAAKSGGGDIDLALADPIADFLRRGRDDLGLADELLAAVRRGDLHVYEDDVLDVGAGGPPVFDLDASESDVVNRVGRLLLKEKPEKAVALIDEHLDGTEGSFRAALYNQGGGANFMAEAYEEALGDYEMCLELEPNVAVHAANAAETAEKLSDNERALEFARRTLDIGGDRDARNQAYGVLERLGER